MKRHAIAVCALVLAGCSAQQGPHAYSGHSGVYYNPTAAQIERSMANDAVNAGVPYGRPAYEPYRR